MTVQSMPAPCKVIPFVLGMVTVVVQVQVPAGTTTVSPLFAEFIAVCTADEEQLEALIVAACISQKKRILKNKAINKQLMNLLIVLDPPSKE
jgi:hypothetical protein